MKKSVIYMMVLGASFSVLTSCGNVEGKKEDSMAKRIELKRYNDSLKLDSFKRIEAAKVALEEDRKLNEQKTSTARSASQPTTTRSQSIASQPASQNTNTTTQQQKKGWSDAAKGGVIGGAAGAGIGALIDKKKPGRGAVIGAAVGGGSGYAIGRKSDRESGRVQKK